MLTQEVTSLHTVLKRLEHECTRSESPLNSPGEPCRVEFQRIVGGCEEVLEILEHIVETFNALSPEKRGGWRLWKRVRFGNGKVQDVAKLRSKVIYYTSAISLFLNMVSMGKIGLIEEQMDEAGGDLKAIKIALNSITAQFNASRDGSVLTTYSDDDKAVWKEFRRELIYEGFGSSVIEKHKEIIKAYVRELEDRGLLSSQGSSIGPDETLFERAKYFPRNLPWSGHSMLLPYRGQAPRSPMETISEAPSGQSSTRSQKRQGSLPPRIDWARTSKPMRTMLDDVWHIYHGEVAPQCLEFITHPPKTKRAWDRCCDGSTLRIEQLVLRKLDEMDIANREDADLSQEIAADAQEMVRALISYKRSFEWRWKDTWRHVRNGASVLLKFDFPNKIIESRPGPTCPRCYP